MRRTAILLIFLFSAAGIVSAQKEFKKNLTGVTKVVIETNANVLVKKSMDNDLKIIDGCKECDSKGKGMGNLNGLSNMDIGFNMESKEEAEERSKGLTPLYANGKDNTMLGFMVEQEGDVLKIKDLKSFMKRDGFVVSLPAGMNLSIDCGQMGNAFVEGLSSELEITTNVGGITLTQITGPVTAHSAVGDIEVVFATVNQDAPISISSSTGAIDMTIPQGTKANVELKSTMGSVFSNFDISTPRKDGLKPINGNRAIAGMLNNGGVKISLKASTGNIYLRKK